MSMQWKGIFVAAAVAGAVVLLIHWVLGRGRVPFRRVAIRACIVVASAIVFGFLAEVIPSTVNAVLQLCFMMFLTISSLIAIIRRRDRSPRVWLYVLGFVLFILSLFFKDIWSSILLFSGSACFVVLLASMRRYPYLRTSWMNALVHETARACPGGARYTGRPVTVFRPVGTWFLARCRGVTLYAQEDRVIVCISRKAHQALGSPAMADFAEKLVDAVLVQRTSR